VWAAALGAEAKVHPGPMVTSAWSSLVCFAGLGPGEVTVGGRKAVGISQRRTRDAAGFQCAAYSRWDPAALAALLALPAGVRRSVATDLSCVVAETTLRAEDLIRSLCAV
jgi:lipoate-protein ligase A